jgi:hypothetical protein
MIPFLPLKQQRVFILLFTCLYANIVAEPAISNQMAEDFASRTSKNVVDTSNKNTVLNGKTRLFSRKKNIASDLYVYTVLVAVRTHIAEYLKTADIESVTAKSKVFLAASELTDEAINLLGQIVDDLNAHCFAYNPEIECRFIKMCNMLKDIEVESIAPHHIRQFAAQVKQFNQYLTLYCLSRKDFLAKEDLELSSKMSKFNQILMFILSNDNFFNIGFFSTLVDFSVYRPMELVRKHPVASTIIVAALIAGGTYLILGDDKKKENTP